jgi:hypothetical protein
VAGIINQAMHTAAINNELKRRILTLMNMADISDKKFAGDPLAENDFVPIGSRFRTNLSPTPNSLVPQNTARPSRHSRTPAQGQARRVGEIVL